MATPSKRTKRNPADVAAQAVDTTRRLLKRVDKKIDQAEADLKTAKDEKAELLRRLEYELQHPALKRAADAEIGPAEGTQGELLDSEKPQ